ncbi:Glucose-1-phosphate thymidylyltransferase [Rickettsiales bacterium Ac37b]|nr:Glucose-1-phosphate thymidylyltransferase [Rickettsiales bacterium Ac37b]
MKGIILAGGSGTRLSPLTQSVSKQILPIYDKPMIYYPLSSLMLANIRDILIISTPSDLPLLKNLLGNGQKLGINLSYLPQEKPEGIAQSFIIGEEFIGNEPVCLILGDNIFYGHELYNKLSKATSLVKGGCVFAYYVNDPERYGVVELDSSYKPVSIIEKPMNPISSWAVTGIYFYDSQVVEIAKSLQASARGELEITDVNNIYLAKGNLKVEFLGRGIAWLDTGTFDSLLQASNFIQTLQVRQGLKIACIEEIAYNKGYINQEQLLELANRYGKNDYGNYLRSIIYQKEIFNHSFVANYGLERKRIKSANGI